MTVRVAPLPHPRPRPRRLAGALAILLTCPISLPAQKVGAPEVTVDDYARAEGFLPWNARNLVSGDQVAPRFHEGDRFWYRNHEGDGHSFYVVDPARSTRAPAFDHDRLAAALSQAADTSYEGRALPFDQIELLPGGQAVRFHVADSARWTCDLGTYLCTGPEAVPAKPEHEATSPDGAWVAFERDENLWVRNLESGQERALSDDGEAHWGYAVVPEGCCQEITNRRRERKPPPVLAWSPDSRRIATHRYDERQVKDLALLETATGRPVLHTYKYALPGDSVIPTFDVHVFDVESGNGVRASIDPQPGFFTTADSIFRDVQWSANGDRLFVTRRSRDFKHYELFDVDPGTGDARLILEESGPTYRELSQFGAYPPNWRVLNDGAQVLWWSERDGWGHLYLFDAEGNRIRQVTSGPWLVLGVHHVDEVTGSVLFTAVGREEGRHAYFRHVYRVGLDGSGLTLLTPEDADHAVTLSPSGRFLVDTYSTPEAPPVTVVRSASDGRVLQTLEQADISALEEEGWVPPVPFRAKGRDGVTDVYGLLWFPSDYDPTGSYPVIDYIYPGPQIGAVTLYPFSAPGRGNGRALAELGFIVFAVDATGTPLRSKAFHDAYYGNMGDNGIPDHIAALKELARRHPGMDLSRVGIFGHSGGGFSSTDAILRHGDFFKVAVSGAGNHDNRGYHFPWGEKYHGLLERNDDGSDSYDSQANQNLAERLEGKLLLTYGTLDDNVHPNMTLNLVDELIRLNKDFDMLVLPNRNHGYASEPYVVRRTWDYFVEHLLGADPPRQYRIDGPGGRR